MRMVRPRYAVSIGLLFVACTREPAPLPPGGTWAPPAAPAAVGAAPVKPTAASTGADLEGPELPIGDVTTLAAHLVSLAKDAKYSAIKTRREGTLVHVTVQRDDGKDVPVNVYLSPDGLQLYQGMLPLPERLKELDRDRAVAACLADKSVRVFIRRNEAASNTQLTEVGAFAERVAIDCAVSDDNCKALGITVWPSVRMGDRTETGLHTRDALLAFAGCAKQEAQPAGAPPPAAPPPANGPPGGPSAPAAPRGNVATARPTVAAPLPAVPAAAPPGAAVPPAVLPALPPPGPPPPAAGAAGAAPALQPEQAIPAAPAVPPEDIARQVRLLYGMAQRAEFDVLTARREGAMVRVSLHRRNGRETPAVVFVTPDGKQLFESAVHVALQLEQFEDDRRFAVCLGERHLLAYVKTDDKQSLLQLAAMGAFAGRLAVDCGASPDACEKAGITEVPTLVMGEQKIAGAHGRPWLETLTGCK